MSLILEALKKSERERRLGEAPSLGSPIIQVRRRRSLMPYLIALIALGLGAYWWMNRSVTDSAPATAEAPSAAPAATTNPAAAPQAPVLAGTDPTAPADASSTAATRDIAQSTAADRLPRSRVEPDPTTGLRPDLREKVKSGELVVANPQLLKPGEPATIKESEAMAPSAVAPPMPAGDPQAVPAEPATVVAEHVKTVEVAPAPEVPKKIAAGEATAPAKVAPTATDSPPPSAPPPAAAVSQLPLLWELPYAKRREIPELKLTMHVYAAVPAQRFVIINGNRQMEGDDIDGLRVVEIRGEGVVFDHQGQRFLFPRGGR
jgi:general secretion pathway protein B